MKIALFGGVYNNYLALEAAIDDAQKRNVDRIYCLGDLGAFGPYPDRVFPLLHDANVECVQGNYDDSIGHSLNDCQCGYTDPRDNLFAQISYDYTLANTNETNREWLRSLPPEIRFEVNGWQVLLCHGSPRRTNEFLWQSTTSTAFLNRLADEHQADIIIGTHTGIHWERELSQGRHFINVGVLGRPENDGQTNVWYTVLTIDESQATNKKTSSQKLTNRAGASHSSSPLPAAPFSTREGDSPREIPKPFQVEFVPVVYDHQRLAREMKQESLPEEFIDTILTGWWSTCLEVLPSKERLCGKY